MRSTRRSSPLHGGLRLLLGSGLLLAYLLVPGMLAAHAALEHAPHPHHHPHHAAEAVHGPACHHAGHPTAGSEDLPLEPAGHRHAQHCDLCDYMAFVGQSSLVASASPPIVAADPAGAVIRAVQAVHAAPTVSIPLARPPPISVA